MIVAIQHEMSQTEAQAIVDQINARLMAGKSLGDLTGQLIRDGWDIKEIDCEEAEAREGFALVHDDISRLAIQRIDVIS